MPRPNSKASPGLFPSVPVTPEITTLVADICERLGSLRALEPAESRLLLRRESTVRSVQASLEIEGNQLDIEQITAILGGRRVLGAPKDIQEARNALAAYEKMAKWNPYGLKDVLAAHAILMRALVDRPGKFRSQGVGIKRGEAFVHLAPPAGRVPALMKGLLAEIKSTKEHPLIASCRFHYEFEFIHPFPDGNGRLGRLWQTMLLARWRPMFANLPVETIIRDRQAEYYAALNASNAAGHAAPFVEFMLVAIRDALIEAVGKKIPLSHSQKTTQKSSQKILALLRGNPELAIADLCTKLRLSDRAVKNHLARLKKEGRLRRIGPDKGGHWQVVA
jgi:Fic family protein